MADNSLGEVSVSLVMQGDEALVAELQAVQGKLAGVQDQADRTAQAVGQVPANSQRTVTPAGVSPPKPTPPVGVSPPSPTNRLEQADTGRPVPVIIVGGLPPSGSAGVETPRADRATSTGGVAGQRGGDGDLDRRNVELRQSVTLERERAKFVANPATTRVKREELKVGRDILQVQRGTRWGEQVRQGDELANGFKRVQDRLGGVRDSLGTFGPALASTFSVGTASILGLAAAADPSMFSTFQSSIRMVSIELGQAFVPYVEGAARGLQGFAGWLRDLDPDLKTWGARIIFGTTAVAGLTLGARALGIQLGHVGTAATMAGRAITLGFVSSPLVAGIVGATAIVGGLASAWWGVSKATEGAAAAMGRVDARGIPVVDGARPRPIDRQKDFAGLPKDLRDKLDQAKGPDETRNLLAGYEKSLSTDREKLLAGQVAELNRLREAFHQTPEGQQARLAEVVVPDLQKAWDVAVANYTARVGTDPFKGTPQDRERFFQGKEYQEYSGAAFEAVKAIQGQARNKGIPAPSIEQAFKLVHGEGQFSRPVVNAGPQAVPGLDAKLQQLDAGIARARDLAARAGVKPGDDFKQDLRLPISTRYTTFEQYSESLQIKGLEGNDAQMAADIASMKATLERLGEGVLKNVPNINASMEALRNVFGGP